MESLTIIPDVEQVGGMPCLRKISENNPEALFYRTQIHHVTHGIEIGGLRRGTTAGGTSVCICIPLSDGRVVVAETTLALLASATAAITARHEDGA